MYLLKAVNIKLSYGDRTIIDIDSLELHLGQKIGLVGQNGAGKSTLLGILSGSLIPDEGTVDARASIALIHQDDLTKLTGKSTATSQKFEDAPRAHLGQFKRENLSIRPSGGEIVRDKIALALSSGADILLADEPTTNLDSDGIEKLERELINFKGALVLVSHDRTLLERVCGSIWEIEGGHIRAFPGNYSAWRAQKTREREFSRSEYEKYRGEERRLREAARRVNAHSERAAHAPSRMSRSEAGINPGKGQKGQAKIRAQARAIQKRADMLERKERPLDLPEIRMALGSSEGVASPSVIRISGLTLAFGERVIFDGVDCEVTTGKHTLLIGPNGSGKTTLLEMILKGSDCVKTAPGARIGYFSQNHEALDLNASALSNANALSSLGEHEVRTILARLEIKGDDVHKKCGVLSGGERAKVMFARLMASDLNTLILDEPSNHIDLYTAEGLQYLLNSWRGTLLLVTHDRRLMKNIGDRILIIEDKKIRTFEGGFDEYSMRKAPLSAGEDFDKEAEESVLNMRMAVLSAKYASARTENERRSLAESLDELAEQILRLRT
ncbi:MAG: ATP-binding cassette domain-containing protein [Synergistaceae bacterium]|nr:ATP-binding cassette domain-containing protein [Synergistaceae bacterium]